MITNERKKELSVFEKRVWLRGLPAFGSCTIGVCFGALVFALQLVTALGVEAAGLPC
jgi:hypothetical protein